MSKYKGKSIEELKEILRLKREEGNKIREEGKRKDEALKRKDEERKRKDEEIEEIRQSHSAYNHYINGLDAIGKPINITYEQFMKKIYNKPKKVYSKNLGTIMNAKSEMTLKDGSRYIDTDIDIKKGLTPKEKKGLKQSVINELDKEIKGSGIRRIKLDLETSSSSSDDEKPRRRITKGKGVKSEIKNYGSMLEHLVSHIKDPKEPIDNKDYKQSKQLINEIEKVKKRGRPKKS